MTTSTSTSTSTTTSTDPLGALAETGVSVWLDDLSRSRIESGNLAALLAEKHVVGVTTNPAIFATALSDGQSYAEQVGELARAGATVDEAVVAITTRDVRAAADVLAPISQAAPADGKVSIEVDPRLAHDTAATIAQAQELWAAVDRPNVMIKIPATEEGLPAITAAIGAGLNVNVTLIFSLERYRQVVNAYQTGLEQAQAAGLDLSRIHSVASFFVSRVDVEIDRRLDRIGTPEAAALRSTAGIANARLAYEIFTEQFATERWHLLADAGANPQRPLWASTGVKDPGLPDTLYVTELAAPHTVNTMPEATLTATADHAPVHGDAIAGTFDQARATLDALDRLGIDYQQVTDQLEDEGVTKFDTAWTHLLDNLSQALEAATTR